MNESPPSAAPLLVALLLALAATVAAWPAAGEPLTLGLATQLALGQSHDVAAAAAAFQSDRAAARVAGDAFHPEASASTTPGVGRGLPVAVAGQVPAIISVGVRQPLFNREERSKGLAARATAAGTRAAYQRARLQVGRDVADLYGRCWTDQQLLAAAERRLGAYAAMARRAEDLRAQGRTTELDLAQARLREARARLRRMELAGTYDADLWELRRRLGLPEAASIELPADPLADVPDPGRAGPAEPATAATTADGNLRVALATDPDLGAAGRQAYLLERARDERQGILAPVTVEADAQYSRLSRANGVDQFYVKFREDDWSVALAITVPLWTGGRLRDSLERADANLERVKEQQRARTVELELSVHRAEAALARAEAARGVAAQASAVAMEDLRISQALAAEGRAQPDDLDARTAALAEAGEEEVKATAAILNARVQLLAVRGDLLDQLGLADPFHDDEPGEPAPTPPAATAPPATASAPQPAP